MWDFSRSSGQFGPQIVDENWALPEPIKKPFRKLLCLISDPQYHPWVESGFHVKKKKINRILRIKLNVLKENSSVDFRWEGGRFLVIGQGHVVRIRDWGTTPPSPLRGGQAGDKAQKGKSPVAVEISRPNLQLHLHRRHDPRRFSATYVSPPGWFLPTPVPLLEFVSFSGPHRIDTYIIIDKTRTPNEMGK